MTLHHIARVGSCRGASHKPLRLGSRDPFSISVVSVSATSGIRQSAIILQGKVVSTTYGRQTTQRFRCASIQRMMSYKLCGFAWFPHSSCQSTCPLTMQPWYGRHQTSLSLTCACIVESRNDDHESVLEETVMHSHVGATSNFLRVREVHLQLWCIAERR